MITYVVVSCNSKTCVNIKDGYCKGFLGSLKINATEFDNDSICPPICETSESKDIDKNDS